MTTILANREPRRVGDFVVGLGGDLILLRELAPLGSSGAFAVTYFAPIDAWGDRSWDDLYAIDFAERSPLASAADAWSCWTEGA